MNEEDREFDDVRRSNTFSWYTTYQSQVVGEPRTPWAQEPQENTMLQSDDSGEPTGGVIIIEGQQSTASKDNTEDSLRDVVNHALSEQNYSRPSLTNGKSSNYETEQGDFASPDVRSDRQMFRPFSMVDIGQRSDNDPGGSGGGGGGDDAREQRIQRSISAFGYEEYKLPKRYQKPPNKINTRLSRTYVTGTGNEKCAKCGGRLYEMEKIHANHFSFHRSCFRCSQCQRLLNLATFTSIDGQLFCMSHNLNVITGMPGNQPLNGQKEELPATEPNTFNAEELSTEVTLASISNMKSIFEVPLKLDDGKKKGAKYQKPEENKAIRQDSSFETRTYTEPPKVNQEDDVKIMKETNHMNQILIHPMETRMAHQDTVGLHAPLANEPNELKTASSAIATIKAEKPEDDETAFKVSDAFAKFRSIEHQNEVRKSPSKDQWPVQKATGPNQGSTASGPISRDYDVTSFVTPERKIFDPGYNASGYFRQGAWNQPPVKNHYHGIGSTKRYSMDDMYLANNTYTESFPDVEIQIAGITRRLRNHWESRDVQDGRQHRRHTTQGQGQGRGQGQGHGQGHGQGQGQGRRTGLNAAAGRTQAYGPTTDVHHHITNGFNIDAYGGGLSYRADTSLGQNAPANRIPVPVKGQTHSDVGSAWVGPMDFTQNQLAKFKQLEAMAVTATQQSHPTKKIFRWGVKEVRPLHRPTSSYLYNDLAPEIFIPTSSSSASAAAASHRLPTIEEHDWKNPPGSSPPPSLPGGHEPEQTTAAVARASRDVIDSPETTYLTSVREALAQFKSLEDLSRPSPNPVVAMSQQKAAMATAPKPYHDVIHSAYNVQVAAKE